MGPPPAADDDWRRDCFPVSAGAGLYEGDCRCRSRQRGGCRAAVYDCVGGGGDLCGGFCDQCEYVIFSPLNQGNELVLTRM